MYKLEQYSIRNHDVVYKKTGGTRGHHAKRINPHPINMHFLKSLNFIKKGGIMGAEGTERGLVGERTGQR